MSGFGGSHRAKTIITFAALAITTSISFFSVPISISYFGNEQYSIFSLVGDTLAYLALANLGVPSAVATAFANLNDINARKKLIRSGLLISIVISLCLLSLLLVIYFKPNLVGILLGKIPESIFGLIARFFVVSLFFFIIQLPLGMYGQLLIYLGYIQISKLIAIFSSILTLLVLLFVIYFKLSIVSLVALNGVVGLLSSVLIVLIFYNKLNGNFHTTKTAQQGGGFSVTSLLKNSYFYFINSIAGLLIMNTDSLVISHSIGISHVVKYSIANKLILLIISIMVNYILVFVAEFPKYLDQPENTRRIVQKLLRRFCIGSIVVAIGINLCLVPFVELWTNHHIVISHELALFFSLYILCVGLSQVPYYFLYSLNMIQDFYRYAIFEGILNLLLSLVLVRYLGVAGVILATFVSHLCCSTVVVNYLCINKFPDIFTRGIIRELASYFLLSVVLILMGYAFFNFKSSFIY